MYSCRVEGEHLWVRLGAELQLVDRLCSDVSAFLTAHNVHGIEFDFNLILREAVCNAIVHGSGMNHALAIEVSLELRPPDLVLRVRDQGPGWNWEARSQCPPPPDQEGGRGMFILENYADSVSFNKAGNEIIVTKRYEAQEKSMNTTNNDFRREVTMGQSLSAGTLDEYRTVFKEAVSKGVSEIVLDCTALEVVDSMGIGLLVATHNSLHKVGGELVMINTPEPVYNLLSTMRLNRHFTVKR